MILHGPFPPSAQPPSEDHMQGDISGHGLAGMVVLG